MNILELNILIIEDNPDDQEIIKRLLKKHACPSCKFYLAGSVETGLNNLKTRKIDFIFLDLMLPDSMGIHTFYSIQEYDPSIPIVILTQNPNTELAAKTIAAGAQDHILKNEMTGQLLDRTIRYALERKKINEELKKARIKAQQADLSKTAFLANMSHEIRTPMNAILGFADLLKDEENTEEDIELFIKLIEENGNQLLHIINDIIDIAKIESGVIEFKKQEIVLHDFISEVYEDFKSQNTNEEVNSVLNIQVPDKGLTIQGDKFKLRQILYNLLSNAYKFTEKGFVETGCLVQENEIIIYVKDSGIGIEPDYHDAVFQRYEQGKDDLTKSLQGSGLGLAITKMIVKKIGGRIWLESEPGKGSTFAFALPYKN